MTKRHTYYQVGEIYDTKHRQVITGDPVPMGTYLSESDIPKDRQIRIRDYVVISYYFGNETQAKTFCETRAQPFDYIWEKF